MCNLDVHRLASPVDDGVLDEYCRRQGVLQLQSGLAHEQVCGTQQERERESNRQGHRLVEPPSPRNEGKVVHKTKFTSKHPQPPRCRPHADTLHSEEHCSRLTGGDPAPLPVASKLAKKLRGSGAFAGVFRGDWKNNFTTDGTKRDFPHNTWGNIAKQGQGRPEKRSLKISKR